MNEDFTLSVIIPVYETPLESLKRALDSACALNIDHEILLVFDGEPNHDLLRLATAYDHTRVHTLIIGHTGLPGAVRNQGILAARGHWITFMDADDELIPSGIEQLITFGVTHDFQIVQGESKKQMHNHTELCRLSTGEQEFIGQQSINHFLRSILLPDYGTGTSWAKIYNRSFLLNKNVRFEPIVPMEDTVFMFDAAVNADRIGFAPVPCYIYHRNGESLVTSFNPEYEKRITFCLNAFKRRVLNYNNQAISNAFNDYVIFYLMLIMLHFVFNPNNKLAKTERRKYFKTILNKSLYVNALRQGRFRDFSIPKRISCFALKHRLYLPMRAICAFRNHQLR